MTINHRYGARLALLRPFVIGRGAVSPAELDRMIRELEQSYSTVGDINRSRTIVVGVNERNAWAFDKLDHGFKMVANDHYLPRTGVLNLGYDELQYLEYHPDDSDMYAPHMDAQVDVDVTVPGLHRRLSLMMQLNKWGVDYTGGDFQYTLDAVNWITIPLDPGELIVFPAWLIHRVLPVTSGIRKSLTIWGHGDKPV